MRKVLFTLHLYLGLVGAAFVAILGLTGCIMAFEPEIDHLLHAKLSYVAPQSRRLSLAEVGEIVAKAFPGERVGAYLVSTAPDISTQVMLRRGAVSVNPYTGEILGIRASGMDFLGYVHQLHLRLLIRNKADSGKAIVSWAAVVMLFLLLSGLYLWWPMKRVSIQTGGPPRRFWFDLHNTVGILSLVFLLLLTLTGLLIGFEESAVPMLYRATSSRPSQLPEMRVTPPPDVAPISPDQAMEIARNAIPGAEPFQIGIPPVTGVYQIRSRFPEDLTPGGRSRVIVDQYTGKVLFAESSRSAPAGTRIVVANRAIHTGDIFGIPSKVVMSLASLMAVVQVISGIAMWWRSRRKSGAIRAACETAAR